MPYPRQRIFGYPQGRLAGVQQKARWAFAYFVQIFGIKDQLRVIEQLGYPLKHHICFFFQRVSHRVVAAHFMRVNNNAVLFEVLQEVLSSHMGHAL